QLGIYLELLVEQHVSVIVNDVCKAIVKNLFSKYIWLPKGERLSDIVKNFEKKWGYPQCFGAIDGTHLPIIAPSECAKDYYNRKGFHSILMQGLVDCNYCFTDIYIGWPGSVHDARIFSHSKLFTLGQTGQLVPKNQSRVIHNVVVPLHIVADPAYPLLTWVVKPFSDNRKLSADQINFNYHLSKARVVTENAFGRMKGRWRCLMKRNDMNIKNITTVIATCAILHNMCEMHGDPFDENWMPEGNDDVTSTRISSSDITDSDAIRQALVQYFKIT
uniref:DDE Tnp4 domain-containing protein n=1 Tax=Amphimedon queenslandica TaxID=400682 RepID=A0A1X7T4L1_AMPQE